MYNVAGKREQNARKSPTKLQTWTKLCSYNGGGVIYYGVSIESSWSWQLRSPRSCNLVIGVIYMQKCNTPLGLTVIPYSSHVISCWRPPRVQFNLKDLQCCCKIRNLWMFVSARDSSKKAEAFSLYSASHHTRILSDYCHIRAVARLHASWNSKSKCEQSPNDDNLLWGPLSMNTHSWTPIEHTCTTYQSIAHKQQFSYHELFTILVCVRFTCTYVG